VVSDPKSPKGARGAREARAGRQGVVSDPKSPKGRSAQKPARSVQSDEPHPSHQEFVVAVVVAGAGASAIRAKA